MYGCPSVVDGNPVGGLFKGGSYSGLVTSAGYSVVTTASQFQSAVKVAGAKIWLPTMIPVSFWKLSLADDLDIASDGGGLISSTPCADWEALLFAGKNNRFLGVKIQGPGAGYGSGGSLGNGKAHGTGIWVNKPGVIIESCEILGWQYTGVQTYSDTQVLFNYIHNNNEEGDGYGVAVSNNGPLSCRIKGNYIDEQRHFIMGSQGYPVTNYEICYNRFGPHNRAVNGNYNAQIDCHGGHDQAGGATDQDYSIPAGGTLLIYHNTSEALQRFFVGIRGYPVDRCECWNNWSYQSYGSEKGLDIPHAWQIFAQEIGVGAENWAACQPYVRMTQHDNWYGTEAPDDLEELDVSVEVRR